MSTQPTPYADYSAADQDPKAAHYCDAVESATLGALLQGLSSLEDAAALSPKDFGRVVREQIFRQMMQTGVTDVASLTDHLRAVGLYDDLFTELLNCYNDPNALAGIQPAWIQKIKVCAFRRQIWRNAQKSLNLSLRADLDTIEEARRLMQEQETQIAAAEGQAADQAAPVQSLGDLAYSYWEAVTQRKNSAKTGFAALDEQIGGGLQPERLYVLIGGTGSGKTTLANQMAEHIASAGRPVFYVTSEDTPSALLAKTVARLGQVEYNAVLYGYSSARQKIDDALAEVLHRHSVETLLYLHDTGAVSLEQMQAQARAHFEHFSDGGPGVLIIDYLQRMARMQPVQAGRPQDTRELVTQYVMHLRAVAEALNCSVLALSSQSRASYGGNGDVLASAKESGDIEYTADCILALIKEKETPAPGHVLYSLFLAKNRLGPTGVSIPLDWYGARQQFTGRDR